MTRKDYILIAAALRDKVKKASTTRHELLRFLST